MTGDLVAMGQNSLTEAKSKETTWILKVKNSNYVFVLGVVHVFTWM